MKKIKLLFTSLIGFWMLSLTFNCYAQDHGCVISSVPNDSFSFTSPVTVKPGAKVGDVLAISRSAGVNINVPCNTAPLTYARYLLGSPTGLKYQQADIYTTNVPGVGIALCYVDCTLGDNDIAVGQFAIENHQTGTSTVSTYGNPTPSEAVLLVIGPVTSGSLPAGMYGAMGVDGQNIETFTLNSVDIKAPTCDIDQKNGVTVDFGPVSMENFQHTGDTSNTKSFDLVFTCDANLNIHVALDGVQSAQTTDTSIVALTGEGDTGVASGLGVQFLYNNSALKLGEKLMLSSAISATPQTLTFQVRYYQVKDKVTPGDANSTATLNFTYE